MERIRRKEIKLKAAVLTWAENERQKERGDERSHIRK